MACAALPHRHSFPQRMLRISGDRTWKRPLTHPRKPFAAWQRLSSSLPASPRGPFVVELFVAVAFFDGHRTGQSGFTCRQVKTPHAGQVARSSRELLSPLDGITRCTPMSASPHPLCAMTASLSELNKACPHRPRSCAGHRKHASDRTSGLLVSPTKRAGLV